MATKRKNLRMADLHGKGRLESCVRRAHGYEQSMGVPVPPVAHPGGHGFADVHTKSAGVRVARLCRERASGPHPGRCRRAGGRPPPSSEPIMNSPAGTTAISGPSPPDRSASRNTAPASRPTGRTGGRRRSRGVRPASPRSNAPSTAGGDTSPAWSASPCSASIQLCSANPINSLASPSLRWIRCAIRSYPARSPRPRAATDGTRPSRATAATAAGLAPGPRMWSSSQPRRRAASAGVQPSAATRFVRMNSTSALRTTAASSLDAANPTRSSGPDPKTYPCLLPPSRLSGGV